MLIILSAILFVIYLVTLMLYNKVVFNKPVTNSLRVFSLGLLLILVTLIVLAQFNTYLSSYWVPKILFWVWLISVMLLFGFGNKSSMFKFELLFYKIPFYLPLVLLPLLLVPFIGIGIALKVYVLVIPDNSMLLYSSETVRIEQAYIRFMGPDPPITVFVKDGLFSHKVKTIPISFNEKYDSIKVMELSPGYLHVVYSSTRESQSEKSPQEFDISLKE